MYEQLDEVLRKVHELMDEYRVQCLWYMRKDYYPETAESAIRVLRAVENNGDLAAFKKAAPLRQWLPQHSSATSAG
ncbi:MAG: hypothetical protein HUU46_04995 [Candidatus Hydrogenedentes bacterium]|nr:hypothetical protein [Candidatus Hydrogenedentota bacterium]